MMPPAEREADEGAADGGTGSHRPAPPTPTSPAQSETTHDRADGNRLDDGDD